MTAQSLPFLLPEIRIVSLPQDEQLGITNMVC